MTGPELKKKLKDMGVTQAHLARLLGTSASVLNNRLKVRMVRKEFIERIEEVLNVKLTGKDSSAPVSAKETSLTKLVDILAKKDKEIKDVRAFYEAKLMQKEEELSALRKEYDERLKEKDAAFMNLYRENMRMMREGAGQNGLDFPPTRKKNG